MKKKIYVFIRKQDGFPKILNAAVNEESQAKHLIKQSSDASLTIEYSLLNVKEEEDIEKCNGLYVLLEDRMMDGKFYPTGLVLQNEEETQNWITENPVGVERKFEEVEIMHPHKALYSIFQNS